MITDFEDVVRQVPLDRQARALLLECSAWLEHAGRDVILPCTSNGHSVGRKGCMCRQED